ncbi:lipid IV(A) 3-deoxy-D-manno-octulosonic acid transferase [Hoeflea sp. WL0058]|uniref:3-deoxy-D-manno-octulosonic acid transferase n=1 Tax=Flavimaribacter sediminis TaxID=2865987 RepID=A0AAE3D083_9HYPH|nr:lipid IV(A) 3-deoxy-D-manno-octulosonic acid transferase [Flavimaribacter sediminis]MBW8637389.1 lipid IV(A) 3-deoxy-D-manno-octulosonic acid transferase [Flavimaribacter sediminis]
MSHTWARVALTAYRWTGAGIYPFIGSYLAVRATKGKEERARRLERYGYASVERPDGPIVWFHAASVGETNAVVPLIHEVRSRGIHVILTTGTVTSASVARERLGNLVIHQYVPLDLKPAISRFLDYWKPDLAVIAESEIWPMTILELGARKMPQVLVNGRLSDRSFSSWSKRPSLAEALFENLSLVVAQSDLDAERFHALGARPITISGNLKADVAPLPFDAEALRKMQLRIGDRPVWAAVSTHAGEEEIAVDVHEALMQKYDLVTVIVPRHPERSDDIENLIKSRGLIVARRSRGEVITQNTDVYLGDTIGEMGYYLSLASIAFVGRSLTGEGGQNPMEPAALGCAILSGRNVQNFRESYRSLLKRGGARLVRDRDMLIQSVDYLISNEKVRRDMCAAAAKTIEEMSGALPKTVRALEPYIKPLMVQAQLQKSNGQRRPW